MQQLIAMIKVMEISCCIIQFNSFPLVDLNEI